MSEAIVVRSPAAGSLRRRITRVATGGGEPVEDSLSIEEPLEIRLSHRDAEARREQGIAITMRTPGDDAELAVGFLAGEGIIRRPEDIRRISHCGPPSPDKGLRNVLRVELADSVRVDLEALKRHFYTSSSCGVCGKASLQAIALEMPERERGEFAIPAKALRRLPEALRGRQNEFARTGGLHAAACFSADGQIQRSREDVGRHNALDKLIGSYFRDGGLIHPGLLLSGRASFELIQKAAMAGMGLVAAIGAPSSLAVELAEQENITLIGFLKSSGFNLYCRGQGLVAP